MCHQNFKASSYCVGGRLYSGNIDIEGDILNQVKKYQFVNVLIVLEKRQGLVMTKLQGSCSEKKSKIRKVSR